jgi:prepilin-type N-terminal cleavage/methylation domain-containing protein
MLTNIKKRTNGQKGFTIIEVLIVLAIAGLILLIVFLAVPALQRSSRNTQRKNDAAAISSAVANFITDNGGSLPIAGGTKVDATDANSVDVCSTSGCAGTGNTFEAAKLGYYTPANVSVVAGTTTATNTSTTTVKIETGVGCNANGTATASTLNSRTAAILYAVENTGSTGAPQCVEQ